MRRRRRLLCELCGLLLMAVAATGCHSYADRVENARQQFFRGDLETAAKSLEEAQREHDGSRDLVNLERAMVLLAEGRAADAEHLLREARDRFDELEAGDAISAGASWLTDDTYRAYAGEDYERVLIRAFLAISNLMHDGGDAEAYSLQVSEKLQQIIAAAQEEDGKNPKAAYQQVAFGPYLRGLLREETHVHYDDAARSYATVLQWQPDFGPGQADLQRAQFGHHSERGNGVLYVLALVGRGPHKTEVAEIPSSEALLVADRIVSILGQQSVPPTLAPIKVPKLVASVDAATGVSVDIDGHPVAVTQTITDVTQMAIGQSQALHDHILGRAVARRMLKKGMIYGAKEAAGIEKNSLVGFGVDIAGVAYEAIEHADTRCWSLLPSKIQVLRVELPAGQHAVKLRPVDGHGRPSGPSIAQSVEVIDAKNRYLLITVPHDHAVGKVVVSR